MKDRIISILKNSDGYVSGQKLCEQLGVSRTAVWKAIQQLRAEGYQIEAVTNKGYHLVEDNSADVFNEAELKAVWEAKWAGHPLIYSRKTGSTNDDIMTMADQGYPEGTLAVTSCQTRGKGRRGRTWISPPEGNIYMSILLRPSISTLTIPDCTLVMALAVWQAVEELEHGPDVHFGIKWPNDLVVARQDGPYKKFVGILTEMRLEETRIKDVTIGIGLNVNMPAVPQEVQQTATTLKEALGYTVNRAALTARCWKYFEEDYEVFVHAEGFAPLHDLYEKALVNIGRKVRVLDPKGEYTGLAVGVTDRGELLVRPDVPGNNVTGGTADAAALRQDQKNAAAGTWEEDPGLRRISSGEISVRGVMGYV